MKKYVAPDNCYNDWLTPPGKTKEAHVACHLVFIKDFKKRHDNLINISNISRKKALTKHENVVVKAFFCDETKLEDFAPEKQNCFKLTCLKTEERFNAGDEVENSINEDESALSKDRVRGVYIYGARLKKPRD